MSTHSPEVLKAGAASSGGSRRLVLHGDDFGMNDAVTSGIVVGFSRGLLTSTSILANAPGFASAISQWKELQDRFSRNELPSFEFRRRLADSSAPFDLGVHLNLTQGRPLTAGRYPGQLLDRDGLFPGVWRLAVRLVTAGWRYRSAIENELSAQVKKVVDCGIAPTHLNAHQYVETVPVVAAAIPTLLRRYSIPVVRVPCEPRLTQTTLIRQFEPANWCLGQIKRIFALRYRRAMRRRGVAHPAYYFGASHAGRIDLDLIRNFTAAVGPGVIEIGMHPGCPGQSLDSGSATDGWSDQLAPRRAAELALLTSVELVELLEARHTRLTRLNELRSGQS
jgi:predicted glycoside hydrolase/deacetylase ChbG (UPF0249 family)